nr:reverse transcriptase domain-containing protein [Tanacetum cinerariifolium]
EEELTEHPLYNKYEFVDHPQLQMEDQRNEFAPYPLPPQEGNMNGWLTDDANDSNLESIASNQPMSMMMEDTDENLIRTLGDYSKPSHEGYRNTIELLVGNNMVPLLSDTIRLVQNGCSFHRLRSKDPNQQFKDYLKLVDSLDLDVENKEKTRLDHGTHFCNDQFGKVMLKYGVTHRLSTVYHPQTSGQVKVLNRGLKRILERTVGENHASWSDKLDDTLWAFRTAFKTPIECTPYKLVYGKACRLPIELEHKAYWALKHCNFDLKIVGDHRKVQLNELNELRDQAYENSLIYKEEKKMHDSKIKNRVFNVVIGSFSSILF